MYSTTYLGAKNIVFCRENPSKANSHLMITQWLSGLVVVAVLVFMASKLFLPGGNTFFPSDFNRPLMKVAARGCCCFCRPLLLLIVLASAEGVDEDRVLSLELHPPLVGLGVLLVRRLLQLLEFVSLFRFWREGERRERHPALWSFSGKKKSCLTFFLVLVITGEAISDDFFLLFFESDGRFFPFHKYSS